MTMHVAQDNCMDGNEGAQKNNLFSFPVFIVMS